MREKVLRQPRTCRLPKTMQPGLKPISKEENVTYSDGPYGRHFRGIAPLGKLFGLVVSSTLERSLIVYQVFEKKDLFCSLVSHPALGLSLPTGRNGYTAAENPRWPFLPSFPFPAVHRQ